MQGYDPSSSLGNRCQQPRGSATRRCSVSFPWSVIAAVCAFSPAADSPRADAQICAMPSSWASAPDSVNSAPRRCCSLCAWRRPPRGTLACVRGSRSPQPCVAAQVLSRTCTRPHPWACRECWAAVAVSWRCLWGERWRLAIIPAPGLMFFTTIFTGPLGRLIVLSRISGRLRVSISSPSTSTVLTKGKC